MHFVSATSKPRNNSTGKEEELVEFRKRLDNFKLTDEIIQSGLDRIKRAFERGETELMFSSFPSSFCTDSGRAIINAGAAADQQAEQGRDGKTGRRTRLADDPALGGASGL